MNLAAAAIGKRNLTVFTTVMILFAGLASFFALGQLEDPEFTIKTASIVTLYPGASPEEVELEVTDPLEIGVQEMSQVLEIESFSRAGMSLIKVYIKPAYSSEALPQIWDELRKKVRDASADLPPGAGTPSVGDDFGDVYGFLLAVEGDGFSYAELEKHVDMMKKELSVIEGVARVELWGNQTACVYIEVSEARLATLGLTPADLRSSLTQQNLVVNAGALDVGGTRVRIQTSGEFTDPDDIGELVVRGITPGSSSGTDELIRVRDIGEVSRGYIEPPIALMRSNGKPSIGLAISNSAGSNIVKLGKRIDTRLHELESVLPVGVEYRRISWQSDLVDESIKAFIISLIEAVLIVLVVLWVAMGLRVAIIVGLCGLVFTIVSSFVLMAITDIDLQRMSLGALIIAMGMMVDNAIVVVDGIMVRVQQGVERSKAAVEAASQPAMPLLGATVIAVLAFYPIFSSEESAGEYCATLFSVVGISLMLSWVLSVTITPIMCVWFLPEPKKGSSDPYGGRFYAHFKGLLRTSMRLRWLVVLAVVGLLVVSLAGFGFVNKMFFPASARRQFMVDYWTPEGSRIQDVSRSLNEFEELLLDSDGVESVSTFIGQGPPRFYLPVEPESPYQSYGQLIVNTSTAADVPRLIDEMQAWVDQNITEARVVPRKYGLGPSETWQIQARFSGPAIADPNILRDLAAQASAIIDASPHSRIVRTSWRQRVPKVVADYDQENARWTGISRESIADATRRSYDGLTVGTLREQDKLLPIIIRHTQEERSTAARSLDLLQVTPPFTDQSVPLAQVTSSLDLEWEDPLIWRWNRRRAITIQATPTELATTLLDDVKASIEAIERPPGYELMWDGEYRSSKDAQASLIPGIVPAFIVVAIIVVALFNAFKQPLIIMIVIPFAMIGVTAGLLITGQPFGFVALLGAMSLAGMMTKNVIVLLDQAKIERDGGADHYDAIINAAVCRLRPVILAAGTTVLGVLPLLQDVFWIAMAVTIMFGLTFGTLLTMVLVPVLYSILFGVKVPKS